MWDTVNQLPPKPGCHRKLWERNEDLEPRGMLDVCQGQAVG